MAYRDGRPCGCGQRGCIEAYASAKGASLIMEELVKSKEAIIVACLCWRWYVVMFVYEMFSRHCTGPISCRQPPGERTACLQRARRRQGSIPKGGSWRFPCENCCSPGGVINLRICHNMTYCVRVQIADDLAVFCLTLCRIVDPEVIIIGGGMSLAGEALLGPLREALQRRTWTVLPTDVQIDIARQAGGIGGILGAALAAKKLVEGNDARNLSDGHNKGRCNEEVVGCVTHDILSGLLSAGVASVLFHACVHGKWTSGSSNTGRTGSCTWGGSIFAHAILVGIHISLLSYWRRK